MAEGPISCAVAVNGHNRGYGAERVQQEVVEKGEVGGKQRDIARRDMNTNGGEVVILTNKGHLKEKSIMRQVGFREP